MQFIDLLFSDQKVRLFLFYFFLKRNCNGIRNHEAELWKNVLKIQSNQNISY